MKVKLYWPDYEEDCDPVDVFWVECTPEEVERKVLPMIATDQKAMRCLDAVKKAATEDQPNLFFLVARDLSQIIPMPWYFPYSARWPEGYPFLKMETVEIEDFSELSNLP